MIIATDERIRSFRSRMNRLEGAVMIKRRVDEQQASAAKTFCV